MTNICVIPARGGSRRIPHKNVRDFLGKPIIYYSIAIAQESRLFDRIIVSTDDDDIERVSLQAGAEVVIRSPEFCRDEVGTQEVTSFVLEQLTESYSYSPDRMDYACCIYATAPLMTAQDLRVGYSCIHPYNGSQHYAMSVGAQPLRDAGQWYWGTMYAWAFQAPLIASHTAMVAIPEQRVCDINTEEDWLRAEQMYRALYRTPTRLT